MMVLRITLILSSIVALTRSEVIQLDNGQFVDVEFENQPPAQGIFVPPYPYQGHQHHPVVVQPAPTQSTTTYTTQVTTAAPPVIVTEVEPVDFISTAVSCVFGAAKTALFFILKKAPALIAGTVIALGVCKFTCLCDSETTIYEVQSNLTAIATPERMTRAAEFVTQAVKKYRDMQKK